MLINVPQYTDIEDKVAGPFTMKQLGWLIALGVVLLILWNIVPVFIFFVLGFPITLIFLALTFYKPYGQPLGSFVIFGIMYYFKPKVYVWKRTPEIESLAPKTIKSNDVRIQDKKVTSETLKGLAELLDSEGMHHNEKIDEILRKQLEKNRNKKY